MTLGQHVPDLLLRSSSRVHDVLNNCIWLAIGSHNRSGLPCSRSPPRHVKDSCPSNGNGKINDKTYIAAYTLCVPQPRCQRTVVKLTILFTPLHPQRRRSASGRLPRGTNLPCPCGPQAGDLCEMLARSGSFRSFPFTFLQNDRKNTTKPLPRPICPNE